MNWNFSAWAIRNPVPPVLLFVVLCLFGWVSFMNLPITRFPNIDVPVIAVTITDSGSAPSELETQVTKPVEDAVAGIAGVKHVISTITDGASTTAIEFRLEINTDRALNDVKDAIAKIRGDLPGSVEEPVVQRIDVEGQSIFTYAAAAPAMTPEELSWFIDDTVIRQLQALKGVGRVERMGGVRREIQVKLDPDRLMALGVTAADVNAQLRATNVDLSGGKGEVGGQEQAIRTLAGATTLADLADRRIVISGGREVRLSELGEVVDRWEDPRSFARLDGKPIVAFSVYRAKGASDADVSRVVGARVDQLAKDFPDVAFERIDDSVNYTYGNFESAMGTLIEGAILAVLVVLLFLRDWRATIIAAVALPLSAIPTFWAMSMMGFSLNLVSLLGITLVTGILVDDAIVEIENIVRHIRMGKSPYRAAMEAADEIGLAVIAISVTIIAIFAPVSFMGGVAGQYFKQFGLTVAVAVFFSLLVARLITPMMAAFLMRRPYLGDGTDGRPVYRGFGRSVAKRIAIMAPLATVAFVAAIVVADDKALLAPGGSLEGFAGTIARLEAYGWQTVGVALFAGIVGLALISAWLARPHPEEEHDGFIMRGYTGFLKGTLHTFRIPTPFRRHDGRRLRVPFGMRWVTLVVGIALFAVSLWSTKFLPTGFIPPGDESRIVASVELPPGATLDDTRDTTDAIAALLRKEVPEVKGVFVMGGTSPTGTLEKRRAAVIITLVPKTERIRKQKDVQMVVQDLLNTVPDIRSYFVNDRGERETAIALLGRDGEALSRTATQLEAEMRREAMFSGPSAMSSFPRPEIRITPKSDEAADVGISPAGISSTIRVATMGDADAALAKFTVGDRQIPIRVELKEGARGELATLAALRVPTGSGSSVPLSAVADIGFGYGPSTIERYDRERLVKVGTDMAPGYTTGEGQEMIMSLPTIKNLPAGIRVQETGDAEIQAEVFSGFAAAMGSGILMVFVVLIVLFNNVFQPLTILASLPLSVGGVVLALLLTNNAVSMPVVIGILMLMGIVTKNAIMLVDFAVEREKHGVPREEAIIDAGRKRARPIVMTTIAMAAGMLPAAMAHGEGGEFRAPMAIAVIGGLIVSTVLSLVYIPSVYSIMDSISHGIAVVFRWLLNPNPREAMDEVPAAAALPTHAHAQSMPAAEAPVPGPAPANVTPLALRRPPEAERPDLPQAAE
ncbi:efflux RND transporter permease subunit [Chthonobacter albigriseus]|uniref:efflux RND transporter permease subunit n=1 Tax=Chthonobacter albigriseus TaxID=1683161 RepID=UPI0015EFBB88|nr:efflux RND transporter permease subunit [Chthonobacter albigriseus]